MSRAFDDLGLFGGARTSDAGLWPGEADAIAPSVRSTPVPISAIAAALDADDAEERRQAAARLGRAADIAEALPLLLRALGDPDWRVRKEATYACHRLIQAAPTQVGPGSELPSPTQVEEVEEEEPTLVVATQVGGEPTQVGGEPTQVGGGPTQVGGGPTQVGGGPTQVGGGPTQVGGEPTQVEVTQVGAGAATQVADVTDVTPRSRPPASASQLLVEALLGALRTSDDVGLRNAAIEVLGYCGRDATPALSAALGELAGDERKLVVDALGRTRDPAALTALYAALSEKDDNLRQSAIEAIAGMGLIARERVTEILYERLSDRDRFVRLTSLNGLNALEAPVPWRVLSPLIDDPILRPAALVAAALAESPEAPRALVSALATARGGAFAQLVRALARLADGPLAPHAVDALRAAPPEVGARLVQAVAAPHALPGVADPPSWRGLGADPVSGRAQALLLAAMARAPGAAEAAVQAMIEPALVETAQRALSLLGGEALPAVLDYLDRHVDTDPDLWEGVDDATAALIDGAVAIAEQDGGAGAPAAPGLGPSLDLLLGAVRGSVRSPSTLVATSALYGLAKIGTADDFSLVVSQTRAVSLPVARAAESALAGLTERHPEAARALARELTREEPTYLAAAIVIEALGEAGPEEIAFLTNAASTGDVRARRAAVTAVAAAAGAAPALDVLSLSLADEEREVRLAAARALGRLYKALPEPESGERARARELLRLVRASGEPELVAAAAQGGAPFRSDPPWSDAGERLTLPGAQGAGEGPSSTGSPGGPPSGKAL
ncbi:HEAT repeat domain-containing protein [Sorangium sp. So ce1036]|uniref:HEAT repeat domain-containing protein n=1 Tax=Sorangium sp. So ce1036 TaxID=3133328 RepID=UPI003F064029